MSMKKVLFSVIAKCTLITTSKIVRRSTTVNVLVQHFNTKQKYGTQASVGITQPVSINTELSKTECLNEQNSWKKSTLQTKGSNNIESAGVNLHEYKNESLLKNHVQNDVVTDGQTPVVDDSVLQKHLQCDDVHYKRLLKKLPKLKSDQDIVEKIQYVYSNGYTFDDIFKFPVIVKLKLPTLVRKFETFNAKGGHGYVKSVLKCSDDQYKRLLKTYPKLHAVIDETLENKINLLYNNGYSFEFLSSCLYAINQLSLKTLNDRIANGIELLPKSSFANTVIAEENHKALAIVYDSVLQKHLQCDDAQYKRLLKKMPDLMLYPDVVEKIQFVYSNGYTFDDIFKFPFIFKLILPTLVRKFETFDAKGGHGYVKSVLKCSDDQYKRFLKTYPKLHAVIDETLENKINLLYNNGYSFEFLSYCPYAIHTLSLKTLNDRIANGIELLPKSLLARNGIAEENHKALDIVDDSVLQKHLQCDDAYYKRLLKKLPKLKSDQDIVEKIQYVYSNGYTFDDIFKFPVIVKLKLPTLVRKFETFNAKGGHGYVKSVLKCSDDQYKRLFKTYPKLHAVIDETLENKINLLYNNGYSFEFLSSCLYAINQLSLKTLNDRIANGIELLPKSSFANTVIAEENHKALAIVYDSVLQKHLQCDDAQYKRLLKKMPDLMLYPDVVEKIQFVYSNGYTFDDIFKFPFIFKLILPTIVRKFETFDAKGGHEYVKSVLQCNDDQYLRLLKTYPKLHAVIDETLENKINLLYNNGYSFEFLSYCPYAIHTLSLKTLNDRIANGIELLPKSLLARNGIAEENHKALYIVDDSVLQKHLQCDDAYYKRLLKKLPKLKSDQDIVEKIQYVYSNGYTFDDIFKFPVIVKLKLPTLVRKFETFNAKGGHGYVKSVLKCSDDQYKRLFKTYPKLHAVIDETLENKINLLYNNGYSFEFLSSCLYAINQLSLKTLNDRIANGIELLPKSSFANTVIAEENHKALAIVYDSVLQKHLQCDDAQYKRLLKKMPDLMLYPDVVEKIQFVYSNGYTFDDIFKFPFIFKLILPTIVRKFETFDAKGGHEYVKSVLQCNDDQYLRLLKTYPKLHAVIDETLENKINLLYNNGYSFEFLSSCLYAINKLSLKTLNDRIANGIEQLPKSLLARNGIAEENHKVLDIVYDSVLQKYLQCDDAQYTRLLKKIPELTLYPDVVEKIQFVYSNGYTFDNIFKFPVIVKLKLPTLVRKFETFNAKGGHGYVKSVLKCSNDQYRRLLKTYPKLHAVIDETLENKINLLYKNGYSFEFLSSYPDAIHKLSLKTLNHRISNGAELFPKSSFAKTGIAEENLKALGGAYDKYEMVGKLLDVRPDIVYRHINYTGYKAMTIKRKILYLLSEGFEKAEIVCNFKVLMYPMEALTSAVEKAKMRDPGIGLQLSYIYGYCSSAKASRSFRKHSLIMFAVKLLDIDKNVLSENEKAALGHSSFHTVDSSFNFLRENGFSVEEIRACPSVLSMKTDSLRTHFNVMLDEIDRGVYPIGLEDNIKLLNALQYEACFQTLHMNNDEVFDHDFDGDVIHDDDDHDENIHDHDDNIHDDDDHDDCNHDDDHDDNIYDDDHDDHDDNIHDDDDDHDTIHNDDDHDDNIYDDDDHDDDDDHYENIHDDDDLDDSIHDDDADDDDDDVSHDHNHDICDDDDDFFNDDINNFPKSSGISA